MKRFLVFILLIAFLLFAAIGDAAVDTFEGQAVTSSTTIEGTSAADTVEGATLASGVSTYCAGSTADIICEDGDGDATPTAGSGGGTEAFSTAYYEPDNCTAADTPWDACTGSGAGAAWDQQYADNDATVDEQADATGCTNQGGTNSFKYVVGSSGDEDANLSVALENNLTTMYCKWRFKVVAEAMESANYVSMLYVQNASNGLELSTHVYDNSGNLILRMGYDTENCYDSDVISTGTWYTVGVYRTDNVAELWSDVSGSWQKEQTDGDATCATGAGTSDLDEIFLGATDAESSLGSSDEVTIYIEAFACDDDAWPTTCN